MAWFLDQIWGNFKLTEVSFKAAGFFTVINVVMISINHVIHNRHRLWHNPTVLQVFVFNVQIMNCNLRDELFSYMRPLADVHISSEEAQRSLKYWHT